MPAKNSRKQYIENGYYHIYNRGVEKRKIFLDKQDYNVFLSYLGEYLLPKNRDLLEKLIEDDNTPSEEKNSALKLLRLNNFSEQITLISYCLMQNHFHFQIKQKSSGAIDSFMNSLGTRYTMYFNKKYKRVGSLYQGVYKGVLVENDEQFLYLSRYIHKQALTLQGETFHPFHPSSYLDFIGKEKTEWVKPSEILSYFSKTNPKFSYKDFIDQKDDFSFLQNIILEDF